MSETNPKSRLVVLISGGGSNLQAILDACHSGEIYAQVVAVISNRAEAYGLERARLAGVDAIPLPKRIAETRQEYDARLAGVAQQYQPDWVILAGWMRLLSFAFLSHFAARVINLHPALPSTFPGTHAIQRAYEAFGRGEIAHTGVMVHLVPDEGVDCGPVLGQQIVPILPEDTLEALEARIHQAEHTLMIQSLKKVLGIPYERESLSRQ